MLVVAMISRFGVGLFTWAAIGVAFGYSVALFDRHRGPRLLIPTLLGLVGGLGAGAVAGLALSGHGLWQSNVAAIVGAGVLALGYAMMSRHRAA